MKIGFIGLGIMGSRMAGNLLAKGHDLTVFNRTSAKAEALVAAGATLAESPTDLARKVDVLFTMLSAPDVVQTLAAEENGFLETLSEGALWIDCSTVNPRFARWMAAVAGACGVRFLDAPVAGTKGPAASAELIFFVGGNGDDLAQCQPLLECMGKKILHIGSTGQGAAMKMIFNLMLANAMAAYSEAMVLGERQGLAPETIADVLLDAPVTAPFLKLKQPLISQGDYEAHFPLRWMHKDLHLVAETGFENGVALPVTNSVKEVYALAEKRGLGEKDFAAVYRLLAE